jgi:hypothetical protein
MNSFFQYFGNYQNVYFITALIACFGICISSAESLLIHKEFRPEGTFSWKVFSSRADYFNHPRVFRRIDFLFGHSAFIAIHFLRLIACIMLPFSHGYFLNTMLVSVITLSSLLFSFRNVVGTDGSDQMNTVIFISFFIAYLFHDAFLFKICLLFIALQSILAYVISGIAKFVSYKWKNGIAIRQIMNTKTYGHEKIATFLNKAPRSVNIFLCWNIIIVETLFFTVVFLPHPYFYFFLIWGFAFHVYNALFMGLNNFLFSFLATYPAIIYLNFLITS